MASAAPVDEHDVRLLRTVSESGPSISPSEVETISALADRLDEIVTRPAAERGPALQRAIKRPDVDAVRAAAQAARVDDTTDVGERLDALVTKLAAYLPPKNGG